MKSIIVATAAMLLCLFFIALSRTLFAEAVTFAIDKTSIIDYRTRLLAAILNPDRTGFILSGILTGVFIGFASKNSRMLTTMFTLMLITIGCIVLILELIRWCPASFVLVRLHTACLNLTLIWGGVFGCVGFFEWKYRKTSRQSPQ